MPLPFQRRCVICDAPLEALGQAERTCTRPQCQLGYRRHLARGEPTCAVCERPLVGAAARGQRTCDDAQCRLEAAQRRTAEQRELERERLRKLRRLAAARRDAEAAQPGDASGANFPVIVVPRIDIPLAPVPEERRALFREHVRRLVEQAASEPPREDDAPYQLHELSSLASEAEAPLFGTGCRLCQGHCCRTGGDHAYLSVATIRRVTAQRPDLSADQLVEEYASRIPEQIVDGSCVFHGELGCVLPREMRADMCNHWLCRGLTELRERLEKESPAGFYIAAARQTEVAAAEFVKVGGSAETL
jgi:hypothetical protein